jgi:hypothetical protein
MTTPPVMTVTDELLAELEGLADSVKGWNMTNAFQEPEEGCLPEDWEWHVGQIDEDDNRYPLMNVDAHQYDSGDSEKLARYYAACNRDKILSMAKELRRLRAENAELAKSLAESRANDQAAMGWLTSLRWASGDRSERMLPELVTHIEGLAKDAGRLDYMIGDQAIVYEQNGTASPTVYSLSWPVEGYTQTEWHKSARDAIDTAMAAK